MTAFSKEEHGMMRGIWGELETMNRSLARLVELLENPPEVAPAVPQEVTYSERLSILKSVRRAEGRCLLCGATRQQPGEGCYEWEPVHPGTKVWAPHSWPEDVPVSLGP